MLTTLPWRVYMASFQFRRQRADYYEYLSEVLTQTRGRKTLKDILHDDAVRYGLNHPRGILSAYWEHRYELSGGDLYACFDDTLPKDDVLMLQLGQRSGAGALEQGLLDMAMTCKSIEKAKDTLVTTLSIGIMALVLLFVSLMLIPWFTVPKLRDAFDIPHEFLGGLTQRLYMFSDLIASVGGWLLLLFGMLGVLVVGSLPRWTGRLRHFLDEFFIWRLYKDFQGMRFLSALALVLRQRGGVSTQLRDAMRAVMTAYPSPWLHAHVDTMLSRVEQGYSPDKVFDTGLIDQEILWYLTDMIDVKGLDTGLEQARSRLEAQSLKRVAKRALLIRWVVLLGVVVSILLLAFWHIAAVQEMKSALLTFYASH